MSPGCFCNIPLKDNTCKHASYCNQTCTSTHPGGTAYSSYMDEVTKYLPDKKYRLYGEIPIPGRLLKGKSDLLPLKNKNVRKAMLNRKLMYCNRIDESLASSQVG